MFTESLLSAVRCSVQLYPKAAPCVQSWRGNGIETKSSSSKNVQARGGQERGSYRNTCKVEKNRGGVWMHI